MKTLWFYVFKLGTSNGSLENWLQILLEGRGGAYTSTLKQYQAKANYFACACLQKNDGYNIHKTPG